MDKREKLKRKVDKLKTQITELEEDKKRLERQLRIKDCWCQYLCMIGFDCDGCHTVASLEELVEELVSYAEKAINCDDTSPVYTGVLINGEEFKSNILFEELK